MYDLLLPPNIRRLILANAPVAIGVSGGKDSDVAAIATDRLLDQLGHTGPRLLIHSDLGWIEWKASLPHCQRLAAFLGRELAVVKRDAGGMVERWQTRWENNLRRYMNLECVQLILPWSSAAMRFCTSELKSAIIARELIQRWPGQEIISVVGLRREESPKRAKAPATSPQTRLTSKKHQTSGHDWHPILGWTRDEVIAYHHLVGFPLHEAYDLYGVSRVSCTFCVLAAFNDLVAAATCAENHHVYRALVSLEAASTFSFQPSRWLADVAPQLLSDELRQAATDAKIRAAIRQEAEARIPRHLLYTDGWPTVLPTVEEARLLADVRRTVADTIGFTISYSDAPSIRDRYEWLIRTKAEAEAKKQAAAERKAKREQGQAAAQPVAAAA